VRFMVAWFGLELDGNLSTHDIMHEIPIYRLACKDFDYESDLVDEKCSELRKFWKRNKAKIPRMFFNFNFCFLMI
jgi:hypothetical protein